MFFRKFVQMIKGIRELSLIEWLILFAMALLVVFMFLSPILFIWAINVLFFDHSIPYTFTTYLAALVLTVLIYSSKGGGGK